jgi:hypothetical protein
MPSQAFLEGLLKPPTSFNASCVFIYSRFLFLLYHNLVCLSPACCLKLEAWSLALVLETVKKFLAALDIGRWERPMIISKPGQQVVVFNSFQLSPSFLKPDLTTVVQ